MTFTNLVDEPQTLHQGETGLLGDGLEPFEIIYIVENNYGYYSDGCGWENLGYFIRQADNAVYCGMQAIFVQVYPADKALSWMGDHVDNVMNI